MSKLRTSLQSTVPLPAMFVYSRLIAIAQRIEILETALGRSASEMEQRHKARLAEIQNTPPVVTVGEIRQRQALLATQTHINKEPVT
jgi:hypothetical protein